MEFLLEKRQRIESSLISFLPKKIDLNWLITHIGYGEGHNVELFNSILDPVWDLMDRGGKRWRPALMYLCYEACGGNDFIDEFLPFVEVIHNGTLMVDDVEDLSEKRRGKPCTHLIFGQDVAINTGNLMYFLPFKILKKSNMSMNKKLKIYELVCDEMTLLSFGQGMDISWHKGIIKDVKEEEYLLMCAYKTGTLARMSAKIGAILAGADEKTVDSLGKFAESIGVAFQIQDDILNISDQKWGKDFGDDITEGKRTLMVIRTIESASEPDKKKTFGNTWNEDKRFVIN